MLFLALSCLQGRPMEAAARDLLTLLPDGLQLTPGNAPTAGFREFVAGTGMPAPTHHGFTARALRRPVWSDRGDLLVHSNSVHPPKANAPGAGDWWQRFTAGEFVDLCLETMYPGYRLGTDAELAIAMDLGQRLAIDVSHLWIQRQSGDLSDATLRRLFNYDRTTEVHVSANDGRRDSHRPLQSDTFGLEWANERLGDGVATVLECYMHRLTAAQRFAQLAMVRGESS